MVVPLSFYRSARRVGRSRTAAARLRFCLPTAVAMEQRIMTSWLAEKNDIGAAESCWCEIGSPRASVSPSAASCPGAPRDCPSNCLDRRFRVREAPQTREFSCAARHHAARCETCQVSQFRGHCWLCEGHMGHWGPAAAFGASWGPRLFGWGTDAQLRHRDTIRRRWH